MMSQFTMHPGRVLDNSAGCRVSSKRTPHHARPATEVRHSTTSYKASEVFPTVQVFPPHLVASRIAGQDGLMTEFVYASAGGSIELRYEAAIHLLVLHDSHTQHSELASMNCLDPSSRPRLTKDLTFVPAGHSYNERLEMGARDSLTFLYVDPNKLNLACRETTIFSPKSFFRDAALLETASKLKDAIESNKGEKRFYSEALAEVLLHELPRAHERSVLTPTICRGGLASWQVQAAMRSVAQHLGEQISLEKLAKLVRLSPHHFCRAFKKSFGIPPHQYVVHLRIERAKLLLTNTAISVTEIASSLGYSQTSTFSAAFRRTTGRTATEFRRDCLKAC